MANASSAAVGLVLERSAAAAARELAARLGASAGTGVDRARRRVPLRSGPVAGPSAQDRSAGRPARHVAVTADELAARLVGTGMPADFAAFLARLDQLIASDALAGGAGTVERLTGRPPRSVREVFAEVRRWSDAATHQPA
jgi:hypothetical protein